MPGEAIARFNDLLRNSQMRVKFDSAVFTVGGWLQSYEPLAHPVAAIEDQTLRLRDDVVSEPNNREANQKSAPAVEDGYFLVPKVIEQ